MFVRQQLECLFFLFFFPAEGKKTPGGEATFYVPAESAPDKIGILIKSRSPSFSAASLLFV